jgi:tetratricopeptide (TPR) repeat protein
MNFTRSTFVLVLLLVLDAGCRRPISTEEPVARMEAARLEQAKGHWAQAAVAWTRGLKEHETVPALVNRAICYRHLHSWDAARADLHRAEALAPRDPLVRRESALFSRLEKFLAELRDLDRQLLALPNDAETLGDRALLLLRAGDAELALDDATEALRLAPMAARPQLLRVVADQALGRPAQHGPALVDDSMRLEQMSPEFLQTIRRLDQEIAAEPKSAELRTHRAWQLNEIGQPRLALADAQSALQVDARSAGACAEASYALAKLKRAPEAYAQIKRATELDPNFSTAWQYRGELEMGRTDYLAAIESLSRALAIKQTAAALAKREECYRKLGLLAKAESDQKALEEITAVR